MRIRIPRKKFLYKALVVYTLVIFLPALLIMYIPPMFSSEKPSAVDANSPITSDVKESTTSSTAPDNSSVFSRLKEEASAQFMGFFNKCLLTDCTEIAVYKGNPAMDSSKNEFLLSSKTNIYCVTRNVAGVDMSKESIDFSVEDGPFVKIPFEKMAGVLTKYGNGSPFRYQLVEGDLSWVSIFMDDCPKFN
jgi:hypothetical protein